MQVLDNNKLLALMIEDTRNAPGIFKPTNYWARYEKIFIPELQKYGLHDFRRRRNSILSSFGATDLSPDFKKIDLSKNRILNNRITRKIPLWSRLLNYSSSLLDRIVPISTDITLWDVKKLSYDYVRIQAEIAKAKPLGEFESSLYGNPEDTFQINGKTYTSLILFYYLRYVYCCKYINFDKINLIVELGCGSGKQVEVIRKLHPHISFVLFDIPPQIYVCEQYLGSVFPDSVVSYQETREMTSLPKIEKGKIYIFGNWKFPIIQDVKYDLFWNAASFQEMEPDVVLNYLAYINNNQKVKSVFLEEAMEGKEVAKSIGEHGVLKQTTLKHYKQGLSNYKLIDLVPVVTPMGPPIGRAAYYSDSFWKR